MVIEDISSVHKTEILWNPADPLERFFAFCLDLSLLTPLIAFVCSIHIRELEADSLQGFQSQMWFSVLITGTFTSVSLISIFTYFFSATPGQAMLNLKIQSLEGGRVEWGQAFLRSIVFHISILFLFIPFIEVFTHRLGRCAHDRISDSIVIQPYPKNFKGLSENQKWNMRLVTLLGVFLVSLVGLVELGNQFTQPQLALSFNRQEISLDQLVAKSLLLKDSEEETRKRIDELLWKAKERQVREIVYFYRYKISEDNNQRALLKAQICQNENNQICKILNDNLSVISPSEVFSQTALVALLMERAERSDYAAALAAYDSLKKFKSLEQALHVWDVGLFYKIEKQMQSRRLPASEDLKKRVENYREERGIP